MKLQIVGGIFIGVVAASNSWAQSPVTPNLSPEFPVPSTLPDATRPAPRAYDCTLARGLGDCSQTPGPTPGVLGVPPPPPHRLPASPDVGAAQEPLPGVPKDP